MNKIYRKGDYEMRDDLYIKDIEKYKKDRDNEYNKKYHAKIRHDRKKNNQFKNDN